MQLRELVARDNRVLEAVSDELIDELIEFDCVDVDDTLADDVARREAVSDALVDELIESLARALGLALPVEVPNSGDGDGAGEPLGLWLRALVSV